MLIILYGDISSKLHFKQQRMIDGGATCGYRDYARNFGHIIYLCPQNVKQKWEHSMPNPKEVRKFIAKYPDAIIWSVKWAPKKDNSILSKIKNKKLYYSCNSKNRYNSNCDVSLVDTSGRLKGVPNGKVFFKGKDPEYWKPDGSTKEFDYILIGQRADKNEFYFLERLNIVNEKRKILWLGGKKHESRIKTKHTVVCTEFKGPDFVRDHINKAKVGVLFTDLKVEGFPQSFLEMTMCGVPVVYNINGPRNEFYFHDDNCILVPKKAIVKGAETLLKNHDSIKCRETAIKNYSIQKSYDHMLRSLNI